MESTVLYEKLIFVIQSFISESGGGWLKYSFQRRTVYLESFSFVSFTAITLGQFLVYLKKQSIILYFQHICPFLCCEYTMKIGQYFWEML